MPFVSDKHSHVRGVFEDSFKGAAFRVIDPEPLIPTQDTSVFFTNAITTRLKPIIIGGEPEWQNLCLVLTQPCLRFHNVDANLRPEFNPHFMTYFQMVGGFVPPEHIEKLKTSCIDFFTNALGVSEKKICVRVASRDLDLVDGYAGLSALATEKDAKPDTYYRWSYGSDGLTGRGMTFALLGTKGSMIDIGNIIAVEKDGEIKGYEFGFGIECMLYAAGVTPSIFDACVSADVLPPVQSVWSKKYSDTVAGIAAVAQTGVMPDKTKRGRLYQKLLRNLYYISGETGHKIDRVQSDLVRTYKIFFPESTLPENTLPFIEQAFHSQQKNVRAFEFATDGADLSDKTKGIASLMRKAENPQIPAFVRDRVLARKM